MGRRRHYDGDDYHERLKDLKDVRIYIAGYFNVRDTQRATMS